MYALERSVPTLELDLNNLSPLRENFLIDTEVVADAENFVISSASPHGLADGRFSNPLRVYRLRDVTVDPSSGLVFGNDQVIAQSSYGWRRVEDAAFLSSASARAQKPEKESPIEAPVAPMGGSVFNYYFFLIHALPRILHVRRIEPRAVVVLTDSTPPFAFGALDALGISYQVVGTKAFRHSEVLICDPSYHPWPHPANIRLLGNLASEYAGECSDSLRKVYIARRGKGREFLNEHELVEFLESKGYVSIQLEELDWLEQVSLLRNAESVVAAHGAGLANIAFMRAGSQVLELTTGVWWFPSMRNIAEIAGLDHYIVHLPYESDSPHGTAESAIEALRQYV